MTKDTTPSSESSDSSDSSNSIDYFVPHFVISYAYKERVRRNQSENLVFSLLHPIATASFSEVGALAIVSEINNKIATIKANFESIQQYLEDNEHIYNSMLMLYPDEDYPMKPKFTYNSKIPKEEQLALLDVWEAQKRDIDAHNSAAKSKRQSMICHILAETFSKEEISNWRDYDASKYDFELVITEVIKTANSADGHHSNIELINSAIEHVASKRATGFFVTRESLKARAEDEDCEFETAATDTDTNAESEVEEYEPEGPDEDGSEEFVSEEDFRKEPMEHKPIDETDEVPEEGDTVTPEESDTEEDASDTPEDDDSDLQAEIHRKA